MAKLCHHVCDASYSALQGSAPRQAASANDLFIPHFSPFDLTSAQHDSFSVSTGVQSSGQSAATTTSVLTNGSKQLAAWDTTSNTCIPATDSALACRHLFTLLPSAVFEQLADPNLLSSNGKPESQGLHQSLQHQQPQHGQLLESGAWKNDEFQVQSVLQSMQQKPFWSQAVTGAYSFPTKRMFGNCIRLGLLVLMMHHVVGKAREHPQQRTVYLRLNILSKQRPTTA